MIIIRTATNNIINIFKKIINISLSFFFFFKQKTAYEIETLFSGDLYVHPRTKVILRNESIPTIINSLRKMITYDFGEMFCCHAGYVQDGKKALHKKLDYLTSFQEEVIHLHDKGWNEKEIQHKMLPKKYPITYLSRGEWNSSHMIRSILTEVV